MGEMTTPAFKRFAVDTNFIIDCFDGDEIALTAWECIVERVPKAEFIIPPTVAHEFVNAVKTSTGQRRQYLREAAADSVKRFGFRPQKLQAVEHGIVERISEQLRRDGFLPHEERNDSLILAESCLLNCEAWITKDSHLADIDKAAVTALLKPYGAPTLPLHPRLLLRMLGARTRDGWAAIEFKREK